jgi:RNA polymerase-binding transcription factor DksA
MDEQRIEAALTEAAAAAEARLTALTAELNDMVSAAAGSNLDDEHDPEGSTIAFEREQLAALREHARKQLDEARAALGRLTAGRYGRCERCGTPIAAERLSARPTARYCFRCAAPRR